ncbi:hypothetical protein DL240_12880 [Lujinxingia litoralis]|uniref:Peptidase C-terminal archaeal/bacterial domain-containing protein n=1 Tax=Lujinxingia litoralis TaxID=2211119 RepID=A0A328C4S0_9DELT|nr:PPC domain-containing protein [Lujinxingia litoralis]RAL21739.1 hypothetical protein DL240_12880 [Lujinxingia litoralis]
MQRFSSLRLLAFAVVAMLISACGSDDGNEVKVCTSLADCAEGQRCNDEGVCTAQGLTCGSDFDCAFDEFCQAGQCAPAACEDHEACGGGAVCDQGLCRAGCVPGGDDCGEGQVCNERTMVCEEAGCTPTSCQPTIQRCDESQQPSRCVFTGSCTNDVQCRAYGQQQGDGKDYICNTVLSECVERPPCQGDGDCRSGEICDAPEDGEPGVCRDGCRSNDDCRDSEVCSLEQGSICVAGCRTNNDCAIPGSDREFLCEDLVCVPVCESVDQCNVAGQVCAGQPQTCRGCVSDSECAASQLCDFTQGTTTEEAADPTVGLCVNRPPSCPEDGLGDNHSQDQAHALGAEALPFERTDDLFFCRENTAGEWFEVQAASGQVIRAVLEYEEGIGNLDLALVQSNGELVVLSGDPPDVDGGQERIEFGVAQGAPYFVQVRGAILDANAPYSLSIDVGEPEACESDELDPATEAEPRELAAETAYSDLKVCGESADFYTLDLQANQVVRIAASAERRLGGVALDLYDAEGVVVASSRERSDGQAIEIVTREPQVMTLRVSVMTGVGNATYSLEWRQRPNQCSDGYSPNQSCGAAAAIEPGTYENLVVCADPDYYAVELLPEQTLSVTATYNAAEAAGELDIFLFGPRDCLVLASAGLEQVPQGDGMLRETLTYTATQGGTYYLSAALFQGLNVPYQLDIEVEDGPVCAPDWVGDNSDLASAYALTEEGLSSGIQTGLVGLQACELESDFYSIELAEGDALTWEIVFDARQGELDLRVFGADGTTVITEDTGPGESKSVSFSASSAGTYYLEVLEKFPSRVEYRLLTTLNGVGNGNPFCPDRFGKNITQESAAEIVEGVYDPLLVCGQLPSGPTGELEYHDQWYKVWVEAGETLDVSLAFDASQGRIDLELRDEAGTRLATSFSSGDSQQAAYTATQSREVYIYVRTRREVKGNVFAMDVELLAPGACVDDRFSGNHDALSATLVEIPGVTNRLRLCDASEDWFEVELEAGVAMEAFIRFVHSQADLNLYLWGPAAGAPASNPPVVLASAESTTDNESVFYTPEVSGTYVVQVKPATAARVDYDLLLFTDVDDDGQYEGPGDRLCPDAFENNDNAGEAASLAVGIYENLLICNDEPEDKDYYSVFVPSGATLDVEVLYTQALGNLKMDVFRGDAESGVPVGSSNTQDDNEFVSVTNSGAGANYLIRIDGDGAVGGTQQWRSYYTLDLEMEFADSCDSPVGVGLTRADASTLMAQAYSAMNLCEGTEHWLQTDLSAGEELRLELEVNARFGQVDLELSDASGTVLETVRGDTNLKSLNYQATQSETLFVRVHPRDGAFVRTVYDLWAAVAGAEPALPFCADPYERNDGAELAATLVLDGESGGAIVDPIACAADEDWYRVSLVGGRTHEIAAFFEASEDVEMALELRSLNGALLKSGTAGAGGNDLVLAHAVSSATDFLVVVRSQGQVAMPYLLHIYEVNAYTEAGRCPDDGVNNTTPALAAELDSVLPLVEAHGQCNDRAYFNWVAPESGPVQAQLKFNRDRHALGWEIREYDAQGASVGIVVEAVGPNSTNRRSVVFDAVAGHRYRLDIQSQLAEGGQVARGPYFLTIEEAAAP